MSKEKGLRYKHLINGKIFTGVHFEHKVEWLPKGDREFSERVINAIYYLDVKNEGAVKLFAEFDKMFQGEGVVDSYIALCDIKNWHVYKIVAYRYTEGERILLTCLPLYNIPSWGQNCIRI